MLEEKDIKGTIFVKAEWQGYGEQMPPAKSETLFQISSTGKNRNNISKIEYQRLLKDQTPLDVNDPRNADILNQIRQMKNDYLQKLLDQDCKFDLHDLQSFRHKLMLARISDPQYAAVPIPGLNSELVDRAKCSFYVEWLEAVHR